MKTTQTPTRPSSRLLQLVVSDLPEHRLDGDRDGWARLVAGDGSALELASRVQRRFLGRTEVAVFAVTYPQAIGEFSVSVSHQGRMRRTGLVVNARSAAALSARVAETLAADEALASAAGTLDFTRFDISGDTGSCRAGIELMGASHVSIAFPPIRSYVRLYPDQRQAMLASFDEVGRALAGLDAGRHPEWRR